MVYYTTQGAENLPLRQGTAVSDNLINTMQNQKKRTFYSKGLYFSCKRCSACCRHDPGFVFLSNEDIQVLAKTLKMQYDDVLEVYCRWVPDSGMLPSRQGLSQKLSLKEKANFDCIFWQEHCTIYRARPLQCRLFPFWESNLCSREAWESLPCPGTGKGELRPLGYIEECLARRRAEPVIIREE